MIYITGDTHGSSSIGKLNSRNFPQQKELTKEDYVIITGDFGLIWSGDKEDEWWLDWLESRNFTTLFVDGNHENFDKLYSYPQKEYKGGKVHEIRPSVLNLKRGEIFNLDNLKVLSFGGATSIDKKYRVEKESWWPQEIPSGEEYSNAISNLEKHEFKVDLVVTHTAPAFIVDDLIPPSYKIPEKTEEYLQRISDAIKFKKWYFGHFHIDQQYDEKYRAIYYDVEKLNI